MKAAKVSQKMIACCDRVALNSQGDVDRTGGLLARLDTIEQVLPQLSRVAAAIPFEVDFFPRVPIRVIWHAADDEFPPACTLLLASNVESFLCVEDIVVATEQLVSQLSRKPAD